MSTHTPYFGIDFGTTYSSMAWYDPEKGEAKVIRNDHDEEKTPSLVFFGEDDEVLIANDAANKIEEYENSDDPEERDYVSQRLVRSIKRYLINPPLIPIPGRDDVRPVEVVGLILGRLKQDAEEGHFYEEIERAVITCPAIFGKQDRDVLLEAAEMAGFREVALFEEPTAAAMAFARRGQKVGKGVLVYDLGAGTFDLSVVVREEDGSLYAPMEPRGDPRCGGDDFDYALYSHCDRIAQKDLGRPISLTGDVDPLFLKHCRVRKESLSRNKTSRFSSYLPSESGSRKFRHEVDRETFEGLIRTRVEGTVKQTAKLLERAENQGHEVDTVVLIGGSSQVPLVARMLGEALPVKPSKFEGRTHAVALGAAYHAYELWKPVEPKPKPREEYRKAVEEFGAGGKPMTPEAKDSLGALARRLRLGSRETAAIEKEVLGDTAAAILAEQEEVEKAPGPGGWTLDNVRDLKLSRTLTDHSALVRSVVFSPNGQLLASGSDDNTIKIWDAQTGEPLQTLDQRSGLVWSVAFSPDGQLLASVSWGSEHKVKLWDVQTGKLLRTLTGHLNSVRCVIFAPDGRIFAGGSADSGEKIQRSKLVADESFIGSLLGRNRSVAYEIPKEVGSAKVWNSHTGELLQTIAEQTKIFSVAFSPDGKVRASGTDSTVTLRNSHTGELLHTLTGHSFVRSIAFNPDGRLLASGSRNGTINLWDAQTGKSPRTLPGHLGSVWSVAFSPDGQILGSVGDDGTTKLWDARTGKSLRILADNLGSVRSIAFSPDGRFLASGGRFGAIQIWGRS